MARTAAKSGQRMAWCGVLLTAACLAPKADPLRQRPLQVQGDAYLPIDGESVAADGHRAPLLPERLLPLALGAVRPHGWLAAQLSRLAEGCVVRGPAARGFAKPAPFEVASATRGDASDGEALAAWLQGLVPLAFLLDGAPVRRDELQALARGWIEVVLTSRAADGWFGPPRSAGDLTASAQWSLLEALRRWHDVTGDPRGIELGVAFARGLAAWPADERQRLETSLASSDATRGRATAQLHWLYDRSGDASLLELAQRFAAGGATVAASDGGDDDARAEVSVRAWIARLDRFEQRLAEEGDAQWADACADVAFNTLPAFFAPDGKAVRDRLAVNDVAEASRFAADGDAAFDRELLALGQGWPSYVQHAWMATRDGGVAALLHGPTTVSFDLDARRGASIEAQTTYPFDATIRYTIRLWSRVDSAPPSLRPAPDPARFPIWLCIPEWCQAPVVTVDGRDFRPQPGSSHFVRLEREWRHGDVVALQLPMAVQVRPRIGSNGADGAVTITRGPLAYSLDVGESWRRAGGDDEWPSRECAATRPWNFALALDPELAARGIEVVARPDRFRTDPFVLPAPIELRAKGRRVHEWTRVDGRCGALQASPVATSAPLEELRLVPIGSARARLGVFPVAGLLGKGTAWSRSRELPRASHRHDDPFAPFDGIVPARSDDREVARFTFWDHLGGVEWIEQEWREPTTLGRSSVFWFEDAVVGGCRVPKSWRLLWRDRNGGWQPVDAKGAYGVARDGWNEVEFTPIKTTALRLEVTQVDGASSGLYEWSASE